MARPSKRTPEREKRLLDALAAGNTRRAACAFVGIDQDTLGNWIARYSDFSDAVQKAEADAEVRMVRQIDQAANTGTWQAAAWWLERRRAEDYAKRDRVDVSIIRREAEHLAEQYGLDADAILAEAQKIVTSG